MDWIPGYKIQKAISDFSIRKSFPRLDNLKFKNILQIGQSKINIRGSNRENGRRNTLLFWLGTYYYFRSRVE